MSLAGKIEVLSRSKGWIPLEKVKRADKLWDGREYVSHDGLVSQGKNSTILVNGIDMPSDHRILCSQEKWTLVIDCNERHASPVIKPAGVQQQTKAWPWSGKTYTRLQITSKTRDNAPVFGIANCGPRQRFVVRSNAGPFIVEN